MRIGIIINSSWNIYNFRIGLIEAFQKGGHQVIAIAPDDGFVAELEAKGCEFFPLEMERKGANPLKDFFLIFNLYKAYKSAKLDIALHFTIKPNIYGTLAARLLNIHTINNVTGLGTVFIHDNLTSKIAQKLYRFAFQFPKKVFFQNQDDLDLFAEKKLISRKIADLLPGSGINTEKFKPQIGAVRNASNKFTFLLIARLLYDKGILEYIDAIRILKKNNENTHFQLLGKIETDKGLGVTKEILQTWIDEGLIDYLGTTSEVRPFIQNADCVVLPSYREGTPRTLLESASMGKPLVATNVAGCKETIIDGVNGFLCEVRNAKDLAEKMKKMMQLGENEYKEMGKQSRNLAVTKFDEKIVVQKYLQAISLYSSKI
ncbi:MAG: glycosyltransferase family 1 protein [Cytophagales bacterium]|nr:MAG: glycosyltransferase family 1 protein [Cytophagales bacterium]